MVLVSSSVLACLLWDLSQLVLIPDLFAMGKVGDIWPLSFLMVIDQKLVANRNGHFQYASLFWSLPCHLMKMVVVELMLVFWLQVSQPPLLRRPLGGAVWGSRPPACDLLLAVQKAMDIAGLLCDEAHLATR